MFIKKGGAGKICTPTQFEKKYKGKGYKVVEEEKKQEKQLEEYTNKELRKMLEEKDLPTYGAKSELVERLKEGE